MAAKKGKGLKVAKENALIAVIGDEDTVSGFVLAGGGNVDVKRASNFLVVDSKTKQSQIEDAFRTFTKREDVAILLISQYIANEIRYLIDEYDEVIPTILEIPSKEHAYEPAKDSVMVRVRRLTGAK